MNGLWQWTKRSAEGDEAQSARADGSSRKAGGSLTGRHRVGRPAKEEFRCLTARASPPVS